MRPYLYITLGLFLFSVTNVFSQVVGFEDGYTTGWSTYRAQTAGYPEATIQNVLTEGTGVTQITNAGNDPFLNSLGVIMSTLSPEGGTHSLKMEDNLVGGNATMITKEFVVNATNCLYIYHYAVVLEDPGHPGRPFFKAEITDSDGNFVPCGNYEVIADNPENEGFNAVAGTGVGGPTVYWYKDWTYVAVNLESYIGQTITITFIVGDCSAGEHLAYAYVDETVSPLEASIASYCPGDETITLEAPEGFLSYLWWTPAPVFSQSVTLNNPESIGIVTVEMESELGNCPITMTVNLNELPTVEPNFSFNTVCSGELVQFTNTSIEDGVIISDYLWNFGNGNDTSIAENPTYTFAEPGIYNVNLQTTTENGCVNDTTIGVTVDCCVPSTSFDYVLDVCGTLATFIYTGTADSTYIYSWDFSGGTIISGNGKGPIVVDFQNPGNYNVSLSVTKNSQVACNTTFASHNIEIIEPLSSSINKVDVLCAGDTTGEVSIIAFGGTEPYSYLWSNGQSANIITNLPVNNYSVTVTDVNNCSTINSAEVLSINTAININFDITNNLCFGDEKGIIISTVTGGTTPYSYLWSNNETGEKIEDLANDDYTLIVTDTNNCKKSKTASIVSPSELHSDMLDSIQVCKLQETTINSSVTGGVSPYTYLWNTLETTANIIGLTDNTDVFTIHVKDQNDCQTSKSVILYTIPAPQLFVGASNDTVCPTESIELYTEISNGLAPFTYTLNGDYKTFPTFVYPIGNQSYEISVTDACGSISSKTISAYSPIYEPIQIISDKTTGCTPIEIRFHTNYDDASQVQWTFEQHQVPNYQSGQNVTHIFNESGQYHVNVKIRTKENCILERTVHNMIHAFPVPEATFEMDKEIGNILNTSIYFNNWSKDNKYNYWFFGDGDSASVVSPIHNYKQKGTYEVDLVVENEYSCTDTATQKVEIQDVFKVWIPTAFSPDGDGSNDFLHIKGHGISKSDYLFQVYDRWGEVIFESTSILDSWDGKAKDNNYVQTGVYKCLLICKDFNSIEHTLSEDVTVIR